MLLYFEQNIIKFVNSWISFFGFTHILMNVHNTYFLTVKHRGVVKGMDPAKKPSEYFVENAIRGKVQSVPQNLDIQRGAFFHKNATQEHCSGHCC